MSCNSIEFQTFSSIHGSRISASGPNFCGKTKRSEYSLSQSIVLTLPLSCLKFGPEVEILDPRINYGLHGYVY